MMFQQQTTLFYFYWFIFNEDFTFLILIYYVSLLLDMQFCKVDYIQYNTKIDKKYIKKDRNNKKTQKTMYLNHSVSTGIDIGALE